jgi:hypothetical protein
MFDLMFIVGITVAGVVATIWLLRSNAREDDPCGGCACGRKNLAERVKKYEQDKERVRNDRNSRLLR